MKTDENEGRLSRWSRLKQEARQKTDINPLPENLQYQTESAQLPDAMPIDSVEESLPEAEQPVLTDADMPPIETLNSESDFSMFMGSGVTDKMRNLALKQLFKAPQFNLRDGLDEYDEDYTFFEKLGDTVTCDMKHQIEMEAVKKERAEAEAIKNDELVEDDADDPGEDEVDINSIDRNEPDSNDPEENTSAQQKQDVDAGKDSGNPQALDQALNNQHVKTSIKIEPKEGSVITEGESS